MCNSLMTVMTVEWPWQGTSGACKLESAGNAYMACTILPLKEGLLRLPEMQLWSRHDDRMLDALSGVDVFVQA